MNGSSRPSISAPLFGALVRRSETALGQDISSIFSAHSASAAVKAEPKTQHGDRKKSAIAKLLLGAVALICAMGFSNTGRATAYSVREEYSALVARTMTVSPLGEDLYGESIDLATGRLEFSVADVELQGNNRLPVEFRRRHAVDAFDPKAFYSNQYHAAEWEIDVPYIHGLYARDRPDQPGSPFGCSSVPVWGGSAPPAFNGFTASTYWHGNFVHMPNSGDSEILRRNDTPKLPAPAGYSYITNSGLHLQCVESIKNAAGKGFYWSRLSWDQIFLRLVGRVQCGLCLPAYYF